MIGIISLVLGLIGAISALWYFWEKLVPMRRLGWKFAEKAAKRMAGEMIADNFSPTLIVGIGRGGAIIGALISGCLGHRPLIVIDREYTWEGGDRCDDMIFAVDIPQKFLTRVLLVSGEVHSGNTMKFYCEYFKKLGAKSVRRATFFYEKGATATIHYKGLQSAKKHILMPWMCTKQYMRADRCQPRNTPIEDPQHFTEDDK